MRKILFALSAVAALAFALPASAQDYYYTQDRYYGPNYAPWVIGAGAGTLVGVGLYNGWYGGSFAASLPSTAAGAAATGGIAGVGTVALIDAATQPCAGFRALFSPFRSGPSGCVNGEFVGYHHVADRHAPRRR
jgi:peptidoglycan/LPS O-acetylase OafA/YrhL